MTDSIFDENCSYCAEGALLDAFGIKIGELPMSKVIAALIQLEIGDLIRQIGGKLYILKD